MKNKPEFTAYALGELDKKEEEELLVLLKENGASSEDIEKEAQVIRDIGVSLTEEFKQDDSLRLSVVQREAVFPKTSVPIWKKLFMGAGLSASCVVALLMIPEVRQYGENRLLESVDNVFSKTDTLSDSEAPVVNAIPVRPGNSVASKSRRQKKGASTLNKVGGRNTISNESLAFDIAGGGGSGGGVKYSGDYGKRSARSKNPFAALSGHRHVRADKANREAYDKIDANPYILVMNQALSTFSVDVDTASYANMRRFLFQGNMPPKDSIRVEELINYFNYDYDMSFKKHPVAVRVDSSISPWNKKRKLVRVALQADTPSNLINAKKNLVFLLDVSGSMRNPKKLPLLVESMKLLVRKLKPEDTISLVVYAGAAGVVLEPTAASEKIKIFKALARLGAGGSTNGGAGIKLAYKLAKEQFVDGGVNRVILATDGDFNVGTSSQSTLISLVEEKAKSNIFLTVIGLGMGNYQDSLLEKLSNRGNGNYAYIDSLSEANKLFNIDLEKNLTTVAKDVKVQVEFNPSLVQAYRLIGYENRMLKAQDFNNDKKDAGEMGAGHSVTAIYEIVLKDEKLDINDIDKLKYQKQVKIKVSKKSDELLTVKVRYKKPTESKSTKFDIVLANEKNEFKAMDNDFRFATAVASFGMKLRNDKTVDGLRYTDIKNMAKSAKGSDSHDFREEFIELIDFAKQIDK